MRMACLGLPCAFSLAVLAFLGSYIRRGESQVDAAVEAPSGQEAQLQIQQLLQVLSAELQAEEQRHSPGLFSFYEFQDMNELDCQSRIAYLINQTMSVQKEIATYEHDIIGIAGIFFQLLHQAPQENSWVWLLANSHEELVNRVHAYFAKIIALSLDQHHCIVQELRPPILDAVVKWKALHIELTSLAWNGFAFGLYGDATTLHDLEAKLSVATAIPGNMLERTWSETLLSGYKWISQTREWFDNYTSTFLGALKVALPKIQSQSEGIETRLHHQDEQGMFVPYEYLRRKVFKQWALDRGLLRGLLRHVWKPPYDVDEPMSIADFGAGGGQYSTWLNETGLVTAYAFDGTPHATTASDGIVHEVNLIQEIRLWRAFDWVMCLEVGEHIPKQFSGVLLQNLRRHAKKGLVMSWSSDWEGIGHVNCMPQEEFIALVERETGLRHDPVASEIVRDGCEIDYIARTVAVFRTVA